MIGLNKKRFFKLRDIIHKNYDWEATCNAICILDDDDKFPKDDLVDEWSELIRFINDNHITHESILWEMVDRWANQIGVYSKEELNEINFFKTKKRLFDGFEDMNTVSWALIELDIDKIYPKNKWVKDWQEIIEFALENNITDEPSEWKIIDRWAKLLGMESLKPVYMALYRESFLGHLEGIIEDDKKYKDIIIWSYRTLNDDEAYPKNIWIEDWKRLIKFTRENQIDNDPSIRSIVNRWSEEISY